MLWNQSESMMDTTIVAPPLPHTKKGGNGIWSFEELNVLLSGRMEVSPRASKFFKGVLKRRSRIQIQIPRNWIHYTVTNAPPRLIQGWEVNIWMIRVVHPGSGSLHFTHPGSRIQGSKRHRIPDPDPQNWLIPLTILIFSLLSLYQSTSQTSLHC